MRIFWSTIMVLTATTLTFAMPGTASAARSVITITQATNDGDGVDIRGDVTSPKRSCERNREVLVYHDVPPKGPSSDDFLLGSTLTNDNGRWRLSSSFEPNQVYARVVPRNRCRGDVSPTVPVVPD